MINSEIDISENKIQSNTIFEIQHYVDLEKKIIEHININFKQTLLELKSQYKNQLTFNEGALGVYWIFNKKTVKSTNQGDINSNNLWKFQHELFPKTEFDEESNNNPQLEKEFFAKFCGEFINNLNQSIPESIKPYVVKYETKNNYFNVYFQSLAKDFIDRRVEDIKPKPQHNTFLIQPIGTLYSCFPEKFSVPRQGGLISKTKGKIVFDPKVIEKSCIEGIEEFEYFWIIYIFHLHQDFKGTKISPPKRDKKTNKNEENCNEKEKENEKNVDNEEDKDNNEEELNEEDQENKDDNKEMFKAKSDKLGIFATRTPHRFNPIGLTLVKLEKVENNEVYVSGIDMVNGTPIIDIKPYHHLESVQLTKYPNWILNAEKDIESQRNLVDFTDKSLVSLKTLVEEKKLDFYDKYDDIFGLIKELLEIDPHSKFTKKKTETLIYAFYVDKLNIIYEYNAIKKYVNVLDIEHVQEYKKLRNKDWLKEYQKHK